MTENLAALTATLVPALALALLHFLWQGAVIGLLTAAVLAALRGARPQARYAIACTGLLLCVLLPAWQVARAVFGEAASSPTVQIVASGNAAVSSLTHHLAIAVGSPSSGQHPSILNWLVVLWAAGAGALLLRMACGLFWVGAQRRGAGAFVEPNWQQRIDQLAVRMGITRVVSLRVATREDGPFAAGLWRPFIVLPTAIATRMPVASVEALLAHELAHIRRHDYLVNLLQGIAEALLFYHPVTWWLSHRIRIERELVADDIAADAVGDRRRLALALAELETLCAAHPFHPPPNTAQAAHGGHLMSRIRQLVRPNINSASAGALLPLGCLALAAIAFCAHALDTATPAAAPAADGFVRAAPATTAATAALPVPAPKRNAKASVLAENTATASAKGNSSRVPESDQNIRVSLNGDDGPSYALVRKGSDGFSMSGTLDDVDAIRAAQRNIDADFVWFRRDGEAWVVSDPAILARMETLWLPTRETEAEMQALQARMQPHNDRLAALSEQMATMSDGAGAHSSEMAAASERMGALGERMGELATRKAELALQAAGRAAHRQAQTQSDQTLDAEMERLEREMERESTALDQTSEKLQARQEPMEALSRQMEAASKPMEDLGREMEAVGNRMERQTDAADAGIQRLIDEAVAQGLARPAPGTQ